MGKSLKGYKENRYLEGGEFMKQKGVLKCLRITSEQEPRELKVSMDFDYDRCLRYTSIGKSYVPSAIAKENAPFGR